jgi:predicted PurR-regulated permease PerM
MKKLYVAIGFGILGVVLLGVLLNFFPLIGVNVVGGFLLYMLIDKAMELLERKGITGVSAAILLTLGFLAIALAFVVFIVMPITAQFHLFLDKLPTFLDQLTQQVTELNKSLPFLLQAYLGVRESIVTSITTLFEQSGAALTSAATIFLIAVTLLASRKTLRQTILEHIPNNYFEVTVTVTHRIIDHIQKYIVAKSVETLVLTVIYALGFWMVGLPLPVLFGIVGGLLNLIPYIGVVFTALPVGLVALMFGNIQVAGLSMLVLIIGRIIDDFVLQTWLVSKFVDVHPFIAILAILVGGEILGVTGMVIAIPAYVISKIIILGVYDTARAVQRHERMLHDEEEQNPHRAHLV